MAGKVADRRRPQHETNNRENRRRDGRPHRAPPRRSAPPKRSPPEKKRAQRDPPSKRRGQGGRSSFFIAGVFFLFVLVYLVRSLYAFLMTQHIATEVVKMGSVDQPMSVSGVIIRDEHVYYAERDGRVRLVVNEFERVKPSSLICYIQDVAEVEDLNKSMASMEEALNRLQQARGDISAADPIIQRVNSQIKNIADAMMVNYNTENFSEVYSKKDELLQRIENRNQMILDENIHIREDLFLQHQQNLNRRDIYETGMRTERSGIVSLTVDGMEEVFTFAEMKELSREQTSLRVDYNKINPSKDVSAGDPVFKIVASNDWYIAAYMHNDMIEGFKEGDARRLYIEKGDEFVAITTQVLMINSGYRESLVIFHCSKNVLDFLHMRSVNLRTSESVRTGLKISATALVERKYFMIPLDYIYEVEGRYSVIKSAEENDAVVSVTVSETDGEFAYIWDRGGGIFQNDLLINVSPGSAPFKVSDIAAGFGVYRVNNGVTEFRKVILDESFSAPGTYIILNPNLNHGIRAYDYIVTDAAGIEEGQIIK